MYRLATTLLCVGLWAGAWSLPSAASPSVKFHAVPDTGVAVTPATQKYLIKGTTEAQLGDYEEAILYYETALDRAPNSPVLLLALADAHEAQGDVATALFYARQARTHGPNRPHYYRRLAELQRRADQPREALRTYQNLLDRFPNDRETYQALADLQATLGRPEAALETYNTLLDRVDRASVAVYRKMLTLYQQTGNPEGITATLQALVERRPNDRTYRRRLGQRYATEGHLEKALDLLYPLARKQPDDTTLQEQVRRLARKTGRARAPLDATREDSVAREAPSVDQLVRRARSAFDAATSSSPPDSARLGSAKRLVQQALDRTPNHVPGLSLLAQLHRAEGRPRQAGQVLERSLEEDPRDAERWDRAGSAYLKANAHSKAASISEEGLLLFPGHLPLARTAAAARLRARDAAKARDHFQKALALSEDAENPTVTAPLRAGLGLAYIYLDRPTEAADAFEAALSETPTHPTVLRRYAYGLALQDSDLDRALKMAHRALDQSPSDRRALATLGWVYFKRDNLDAAERHLRDALEAGPPSAQVLEHFGDVQHARGNNATARKYWQRALDQDPDRPGLRKKLDADSTS